MRRENYRRYGGKGPKRIRIPKWVKELPENTEEWTKEQSQKYFYWQWIYSRRGYSQKEWIGIIRERIKIKEKEFEELSFVDDSNGKSVLIVLKKKLEWQADYFENFGHGADNPYYAAQMRLCCRLIDIICWGGDNGEFRHSFRKYVNTRNAKRFEKVPTWNMVYLHGEKQKLRYQKAHALLFKIIYENIMKWWCNNSPIKKL